MLSGIADCLLGFFRCEYAPLFSLIGDQSKSRRIDADLGKPLVSEDGCDL